MRNFIIFTPHETLLGQSKTRLIWVGHVSHMGGNMHTNLSLENLKEETQEQMRGHIKMGLKENML
jgi:hypothetical protein